jgi:hypothetical protein
MDDSHLPSLIDEVSLYQLLELGRVGVVFKETGPGCPSRPPPST